MINFQLIPLLALAGYFGYLTYYIAAPMFYLKILMFIGYKKYRCSTIRFGEEKITVKYMRREQEYMIEKALDAGPDSRFFAMALCSGLKAILTEIKKENNVFAE